jgi:hypothetical protein
MAVLHSPPVPRRAPFPVRLLALLAVPLAVLAISACGSSSGSGSAAGLLKQTFSGSHAVNSGNLNVALTLTPSGSSTVTGPITLSFGGPFASLGKGKLPKSDFNVGISALGHTGSLGILSTGSTGYVTLQGTSYQLPASTFQQLESSFSSITSSSGGGSGSNTLSKLGIDPLNWLTNPTVVGNENVAGTSTTHIKAGINVPALLSDLNTFLGKAASLGVSSGAKLPTSISPSTQSRIASEVRQPRVDVWTGSSDKTLRKLLVSLAVPVSGSLSTLLGGLSTAQISLSMQYADLNQPQTISAPSSVAPFSQFQAKLRTLVSALQSTLGSAVAGAAGSSSSSGGSTGSGSSSGSGSSGSTGSGSSSGSGSSPTTSNITKYGQCVQAAGNDITKLQACAPLLNGK